MTILHAGGKFGGAGYAVSGGLHGVGISVVNALSTRVETVVKRDGFTWQKDFEDGGKPLGELQKGEATDETGTSQTFWADPAIFETTDYDFETLRARFQQLAFLNKGLQITLTDERPAHVDTGDEVAGEDERRRAPGPVPERHLQVRRRPARLRQAPQHRQEGRGRPPGRHRLRVRGHRAADLRRDRAAVDQRLLRVGAHVREHDLHHRGRHARGGLPCGDDLADQPLRARQGHPQGEGREPHGRRHPRGPHGRHLRQARRAAVRGPDQDEARQHRGEDVRAARGQRPARRLARVAPERGARRHPQVDPGRGRAHGGAQGPRGHPAQGPARVGRHAGQAQGLPVATAPRSARSSSSRATRPAARRSVAATRGRRRSCRSAARSSTSSGRAWTGRWATRRSRR